MVNYYTYYHIQNITISIFAFISAFLASTIPHLEYIISLFGATANTTLCITLPAIIHTISIEELSKLSLLKNIGLILFGISINIIGVTILIQKIYYTYSQPKKLLAIKPNN